MTRPDDFRAAVRRGRRVPTGHTVMHLLRRDVSASAEPRFGFIVTKSVGGAVTRNVVKRRLRAVSLSVLPSVESGMDVVIRALPGSHEVAWATLHTEIESGLRAHERSRSAQ